MGKKEGVFIPKEFARSVWRLSDEDAGRLLKASFDYAEGITEAEVADSIKEIWAEFKSSFEEEARRYEAKCEKNRACALQRWKPNDANAMRTQCERINKESEEEERSKEEEVKESNKEKINITIYEKKANKQTELFESETAHTEAKEPRFQKPSLAEVADYVKEKGYEEWVDPEAFWSYHENGDWMAGRKKMKNWHLAITTWMRKSKEREERMQRMRQQQRRGNGTSVGERAYNMLHFEYEGHPEMWKEEQKKFDEINSAYE